MFLRSGAARSSPARRLDTLSRHLKSAADTAGKTHDYDLIVIGGGSGGLACSKDAASFGKKVAVLDYVVPSPNGTQWGLGGTCVNVGCIPKKLMHQAALLGHSLKDAPFYGWQGVESKGFSWEELRTAVRNHVRSLNWGHRVQLKEKGVDYFNAQGTFVDPHTIETTTKDGKKTFLKSKNFVIAVGGRPKYPDHVPGALEYGITSDDVFYLEKPPGKTLVVGGSYVALECAGFLRGLGFPTTLMVRSHCLKSFDQDVAGLVVRNLEKRGVHLLTHCEPKMVAKSSQQLSVQWHCFDDQQDKEDQWDTVLFATGREPCVAGLALDQAGVRVDPQTKKIVVDQYDASVSMPHIFAIGDVAMGRQELTPVAVKAGKMLARRLFGGTSEVMNYHMVPTTVFTPLEFASVGLAEEKAVERHGEEAIEVYHAYYKPLEFYLPGTDSGECYIKLVCLRDPDPSKETVLGLHMTGPSAGEMLQGFAVAMGRGMSRMDLELAVGIHPTCAEEVLKLHTTKRSGKDPAITAC
eukprot:Em0006g793a